MISTVLIPALAFIGRMQAAPILPYSPHNMSSIPDAQAHSPACNDIHHCRTLRGIIFNCLATIFACTWFSSHPDIPNPTYTLSSVRVIRAFSMLFSFLLPELTVAKAATQCWKVSKYKSRYRVQDVHRAQIYFALMGGFFDCEDPGKRINLDNIDNLKPSGSAEKSSLEDLVSGHIFSTRATVICWGDWSLLPRQFGSLFNISGDGLPISPRHSSR